VKALSFKHPDKLKKKKNIKWKPADAKKKAPAKRPR
jgi:hypothetical protein